MAKDLGPKGLEVRAEADARATETAPDPSFHDSDPSPEPVPRKTRARRLTARAPPLFSPSPLAADRLLPLQPVRSPGTRQQRRDQAVRRGQVRLQGSRREL